MIYFIKLARISPAGRCCWYWYWWYWWCWYWWCRRWFLAVAVQGLLLVVPPVEQSSHGLRHVVTAAAGEPSDRLTD